MQKFKKTLLASAIVAVVPSIGAMPANAQGGVNQLEEVVVTGTRKEGLAPTETLSPIDLIGGKALVNQGAFDLTDSLTKISPALNTQRFPIADGTAFVRPVTLRNLSPDHTLVLMNGTRRHRSALVNLQLAPLGTVNQGSQGVDFQTFPSAAIKRIEVLRDGASAQYGSDAIAGVVNVILNDAAEGFTVSGQYGEYQEGDGERTSVAANGGLGLGDAGFLNLTAEYSESDTTSRGQARPDAAAVADIVGKSQVPYDGLGQRWGDPEIETWKFVANTAYTFSDALEVYGTGTYMDQETTGGFFYRGPVLPGDLNKDLPARTTLKIDADGDGFADAAAQDLVDSILAQGLTPGDYLTANADSPSGFDLLNPINTLFPGGYSPLFGADIADYELVFGGRGELGDMGLSYDVRGRYGENEVEYNLVDSINPSLGALSPTDFNPGTLTQEESSVNADFVKTFDSSPLNLGFGLEWRNETYIIDKGDAASTAVGPTFAVFGLGSDGFQGFSPESVGEFESDSWAAYVDVETDITDNLSGAIAVRYEDYDEFGDTTDWKISARYNFTDNFALRATANTGFRAPSPGQVNTLNVTTTADSSGNLIPTGTYPVDNPISQVLGSQPLSPEESESFTLGLVWTPGDRYSITVDYYDISIDDRLALVQNTLNQDNVDELAGIGFENAELLLNAGAAYFANGFDTNVSGIDISVSAWYDLWGGTLVTDWRHNWNEQEIDNVKNSSIGPDRVFDLENQVPENSSVLTFDYERDAMTGLVRLNYYDEWSSTGGLFGPGDASDAATYGSTVLVDVEFSYTFADHYTVSVGGENVFDETPDDEADGTLGFLGAVSSVTSPYGFNGAFWYARVSASF
ncbi:TonB-dependent receptor plug domain-containing protein [Pseudohalioglobus lutimaris]|uniref:TonB-dependent receptor n=1 Tax=Pseudohalioglobus lutimaris TaxID=1737061 RepID=A0A2N5WYH8_9GAMM|nr:TonB-dependent receptor [Pseudohalioglobus lutimaris]PLW67279.1 TonB-dependent receptor [Pseudohalioglobus lutimaris]